MTEFHRFQLGYVHASPRSGDAGNAAETFGKSADPETRPVRLMHSYAGFLESIVAQVSFFQVIKPAPGA